MHVSAFRRSGAELVKPHTQTLVAGWHHAVIGLLVAGVYFAGTKIGFALTPPQTPIAVFWPPNALLLAAFLLTPVRRWWIYLLAVLPAHVLSQAQIGVPLAASLGWYIGNTGEALIGAAIIVYFKGIEEPFRLEGAKDLKVFLLGAVLAAPCLTSFIDAATAVWARYSQEYWLIWATRLASNVISNLSLVPSIVLLFRGGAARFRQATTLRALELAGLALGLALASFYAVSSHSPVGGEISAAVFAPLPFLLWAALRFGVWTVSSSLLIVALTSLNHVVHHLQRPGGVAAMAEDVLTLQALIAALGVTLLWLAVTVNERKKAESSAVSRMRLIEEQERALRRVGRKLHAELTQQLTLLGLDVEDLSGNFGSSALLRERLQLLNRQIAHLSTSTRDWSHHLDPVDIQYLGLARALDRLLQHTEESSSLRFAFSADEAAVSLDPLASLCLYRIVQDAIENQLESKAAGNVRVKLEANEMGARLTIEDAGQIAAPENCPRIIGMRERVALLGGAFALISSPAGTRI